MRNSFLYHTQLHAENFTPAFVLGGDFWRLYLDEDCLGGCRELAVYSSKQAPPRLEKTEDTVRWIYDTINVSYYENTTTSILYKPASNINYGTLISYYYGTNGLDLKGISYVSATAVPYFEIS